MNIRLLLADDHPVVLKGLKRLFDETPGFDLVATCRDGISALDEIARLCPDVAMVDLHMPRLDGLGILRELRSRGIEVPTIILAAYIDEVEAIQAMKFGVRGLILKEMEPDLLIRCVKKVHAGGQWIERNVVGLAIDRLIHQTETMSSLRVMLTDRELQIMKLVAEGSSGREAAAQLGISYGTVKSHLHSVYSKLELKGRAELMSYAKKRRLV